MRFSDEFLTELRARIDIEDLIARYAEVRGRGRTPVCLCPFHNEKTPSFVIYKDTQSYYCFGCGAGGDAITFIRNIENLDYAEAVRYLCEKTGIAFPTDPINDEAIRLRRRCYEANREAAKFFHQQLQTPQAQEARAYIAKRELKKETVVHFGLGFAPASWDALLKHMKALGYTEGELLAFDLARRTSKGGVIDAFRNRLMFPIIDLRGNVIAFGGRVLDDSKPKYLNTSDTIIYKKSQALYALNFAKNGNNNRLILCEGYMDVIALHQAGFSQAIAGLGTAFTPEQAKLLSRYCTELLVCFDSDEAGQKATARAQRILANTDVKVRVVRMQVGKDPDEMIKKYGAERMREILEGAVSETEFALQNAKKRYDIDTPDGKVNYLNEAVDILAGLQNDIKRDIYINMLATELSVAKEAIAVQVEKARKKNNRKAEREMFSFAVRLLHGDTLSTPNPEKSKYPRAVKTEEYLLSSLLKNPQYLQQFNKTLTEDTFITDYNKTLFRSIASHINSGESLSPSSFAEETDDAGVAYFSRLLALQSSIGGTVAEFGDFIKTLETEKNRLQKKRVEELTDEQFLSRIAERKK